MLGGVGENTLTLPEYGLTFGISWQTAVDSGMVGQIMYAGVGLRVYGFEQGRGR